MGSLDGRVAVITGAGRGIGASVARLFAHEGAAVVVNDLGASLSGLEGEGSPADELVKEINDAGGTAVANSSDISINEAACDLIESAIGEFGKLDILVNVAGILRDRMVFNMSEEEWDAVIRVHLKGHFNTIRPAAAYWRSLGDSDANHRLINFTSRAGLYGAPGQPNYSAAKLGIVGLTYSCAVALRRYGVTTNAISPAAATRMTIDLWSQDQLNSPEAGPDNVAPIVAYIASARSGWCNGQVIGSHGFDIDLYNTFDPVATVRTPDGWDLEKLGERIESTFRPFTDAQPPNPFV